MISEGSCDTEDLNLISNIVKLIFKSSQMFTILRFYYIFDQINAIFHILNFRTVDIC